MDTLANLVDLYLLRCEVEGKSPNIVRAYGWTLKRFLAILHEQDEPERADAIERDHIYAVLSELRQRRTIRRHLGQRDSLRRV